LGDKTKVEYHYLTTNSVKLKVKTAVNRKEIISHEEGMKRGQLFWTRFE